MKRIYRLLVILMGLIVFVGAYVLVKQDKYSNIQMPSGQSEAAKADPKE